jgi:predicted nucleic acid-binding protein
MIVVCNSSPLIALSKIDGLVILQHWFKQVYIPTSVFQETVLQSHLLPQQEAILTAIAENYLQVVEPHTSLTFKRVLGLGEQGVIQLAVEKQADLLLMDDRKAHNEATEFGFTVLKTAVLLQQAESLGIIASYSETMQWLEKFKIYLPK